MSDTETKKAPRRVLLLDADLLGFAAGTFVCAGVVAAGFFRLELSAFEIALRAGQTFVVTYMAVFLLVKYLIHTALREMVERRRAELEQAAKAHQNRDTQPPQDELSLAGQETGEVER